VRHRRKDGLNRLAGGGRQFIGAYCLARPWTKRAARITCSYVQVLIQTETFPQQPESAVQEYDVWR